MLMSRFTTVQAIPINYASMEMFLTGAQSEFFWSYFKHAQCYLQIEGNLKMADYLDGETVRNTTEIVLTHQETRIAKDGEDKF